MRRLWVALFALFMTLADVRAAELSRILVGFPPGQATDLIARLLAEKLGPALGETVIVENRPGQGGSIVLASLASSAPDGHTMVLAPLASMVINPHMYRTVGYDSLKSFAPVALIGDLPMLMVVNPSLPVNNVAELIAYAKANPGKLNYGSGGVGATPYLAVELLKSMAGFDAVHVPYRGGAPALADLVAGQLSFMIENVPGTLPFVKDGKLRALAITSRERSSLVPDLPTMIEAGVLGYEMVGWNGIFVPKGTGSQIVERLNGELVTILRGAELREQFAKLGAEAIGNSPIDFAAFVREESMRWGKIIRDRGIKPE